MHEHRPAILALVGSSDNEGWARDIADCGQAFAHTASESGLAGTQWPGEHNQVTRFEQASQFETQLVHRFGAGCFEPGDYLLNQSRSLSPR